MELPDNDEAIELIENIHAVVCGGAMVENAEGEQEHKCGRDWQASVHGYVPVFAREPEPTQIEVLEAEDFNGE